MTRVIDESLGARRRFYDRVEWRHVEPYQLEVRQDLLGLLPEDVRSILDLGCGNGYIANALAGRGIVVGVDISAVALRYLKVPGCLASAAQLPFPDRTFDLVVASEVIEHLPSSEFAAALGEIQRVANRYVLTSVPFAEDLAAGRRYSAQDDALRHVNDHRRAFDLPAIMGLYAEFELDSVVFTGVEWLRESRPVEAFNALMTELGAAPLADHPAERVLSQGKRAAILQFLRADQARALGHAPEIVDFCRLRTGMMGLYRRRPMSASGDGGPISHAIRRMAEVAAAVPVTHVDLNVIDFRQLDRHRQPWLPTMSRFPYAVTAATAVIASEGTRFAPCEEGADFDVKIGFFCNFEGSARLEIAGMSDREVTLSIAHYGSAHTYHVLDRRKVSGDFVIAVDDAALSHSQYGMLFAVTVSGGGILLKTTRIISAEPSHRPVYARAVDYIRVVDDGIDCFLSCRHYGRDVPVLRWFQDPLRVRSRSGPAGEEAHEFAIQLGTIANMVLDDRLRDGQSEISWRKADQMRLDELEARYGESLGKASAQINAGIADQQQQLAEVAARIDALVECFIKRLDAANADITDQHRQTAQVAARIDALSEGIMEKLAAANAEMTDQHRQLAEVGKRIDAVAVDLVEAFGGPVWPIADLGTRLQQQMVQRFATLTGELQALRHEQRLRRGPLGLMREMFNINDYIESSGRPKRGVRLPLAVRLYFRLRDSALARPLRRARDNVAGDRAVAQVATEPPPHGDATPAAPHPSPSPAPTVTMLVPDDRIDRRVLLSGRSLSEAGWNVTVVAAPYPGPLDQDQIEFPELHIDRIDTGRAVNIPPEALPENWRHSEAWRDVYFYHFNFLELALRHSAQVYVANDLPVLPAAAVAAAQFGAALVFDAHELFPEIGYYSPEQRALYSKAEADLIRDCALVTTINQSIAEEMARCYGIATPEILLNSPAARPAQDKTPVDALRQELQISAVQRILLYQGAFALYRNLEDLIAAMAIVQSEDIVLVMMGPDAERRDALEAIAREGGTLGRRVLFRDPVPPRVLLSYTAGADVGIVPYPAGDLNSRYCTPNKLFEFIVAGIPILANDLPELRKFVHDTGFGQVHRLDGPASIASAIDAMFRSDLQPFRDRLAARRHEFTWEAQGRKLVGLYRALAPEMAGLRRPIEPSAEPTVKAAAGLLP